MRTKEKKNHFTIYLSQHYSFHTCVFFFLACSFIYTKKMMMIANDDKIMMNGMVPRIFFVLFLVHSKQKQNKKNQMDWNSIYIFCIFTDHRTILIFWMAHTHTDTKKSACSNWIVSNIKSDSTIYRLDIKRKLSYNISHHL